VVAARLRRPVDFADAGARDVACRASDAALFQTFSPRFPAVTPAARAASAAACAARRALACSERTSRELMSVWMCAPLVRHAALTSAVAAAPAFLSASKDACARILARRASALAAISAAARRASRLAFPAIALALLAWTRPAPRRLRPPVVLVFDGDAMTSPS
jgi:hypothetical protein